MKNNLSLNSNWSAKAAIGAARYLALSFLFIAQIAHADSAIRIWIGVSADKFLMAKIIPAFEEKAKIKIQRASSSSPGTGILYGSDVLNGKVDAAVTALPWGEWRVMLQGAGFSNEQLDKVTYRVIGNDRMNFLVHPSTGIKKLSYEQLAAIYSGKAKNWTEMGGKDLAIRTVSPRGMTGAIEILRKQLLKNGELAPASLNVNSYDEVLKAVTNTEGMIGWVPRGTLNDKVILVDTPVVGRPVTFITLGKPNADVTKLIEFINKEGQVLIKD